MVENNKENPNDHTFDHIKEEFSTTDIRTVYAFKKMIGGGNFGTCRTAYKKTDPNKIFAVKSVLREKIAKDINLLEAELEILKNISHPNIIKFHEAFIDHKYVHMVTDFCEGGELFDRIVKKGKFDEHYAAELAKKMLQAVNHLHS
mmetsp:Transcript_20151/g.14586  ORF Transcript_20151/g.14586 Transcript_20151/m.14586 type:complete len:146 (+) Transcript_20151:3-440(+)